MEGLGGKRILFVITKSNWGGAQSYVHALATNFAREGADVCVAFGGSGSGAGMPGHLAERLSLEKIRTVPLPALARDISLRAEFRAFKELVALFRAERPDILHLNSSKAGALGALAGRVARVPRIVFTAHGWPHREPRPFPVRAFIWFSSWLTVLLSHRVIAVSQYDRKTAPVLFSRAKVNVVHNGIKAFTLLSRTEARQELIRKEPRLLDSTPWILMLAELHANKGIDTAVLALAQLKNHPETVLVVLGAGEERERLLALARAKGMEGRVFLLGFLPDARSFLRAADLFLMPSRKEGLPIALLEAGVAGLPVIASRTGGIPEVVTAAQSGLLVAPNDVAGFATALARLLDERAEANEFGAALQKTVHDGFSEERMLEGTRRSYAAP